MSAAAVAVGIAIIERDGRYLVGTRPGDVPLAGCAEFPGGKCEPGETPEACAIRECAEETGLVVESKRLLDRVTWEYPHATVELSFILCDAPDANVEPRPPFRWVERQELATLNFPPANESLIRMLTR